MEDDAEDEAKREHTIDRRTSTASLYFGRKSDPHSMRHCVERKHMLSSEVVRDTTRIASVVRVCTHR